MTNTTYHQSDSEAATVVPADQGVPMAARVAAVLLLLAALVNFLIFSVLAGSPTWWILGGGFGFVLLAGLILAPAVLAASLIVRPSRRAAWLAAAWTLPALLTTWAFVPNLVVTLGALTAAVWAASSMKGRDGTGGHASPDR